MAPPEHDDRCWDNGTGRVIATSRRGTTLAANRPPTLAEIHGVFNIAQSAPPPTLADIHDAVGHPQSSHHGSSDACNLQQASNERTQSAEEVLQASLDFQRSRSSRRVLVELCQDNGRVEPLYPSPERVQATSDDGIDENESGYAAESVDGDVVASPSSASRPFGRQNSTESNCATPDLGTAAQVTQRTDDEARNFNIRSFLADSEVDRIRRLVDAKKVQRGSSAVSDNTTNETENNDTTQMETKMSSANMSAKISANETKENEMPSDRATNLPSTDEATNDETYGDYASLMDDEDNEAYNPYAVASVESTNEAYNPYAVASAESFDSYVEEAMVLETRRSSEEAFLEDADLLALKRAAYMGETTASTIDHHHHISPDQEATIVLIAENVHPSESDQQGVAQAELIGEEHRLPVMGNSGQEFGGAEVVAALEGQPTAVAATPAELETASSAEEAMVIDSESVLRKPDASWNPIEEAMVLQDDDFSLSSLDRKPPAVESRRDNNMAEEQGVAACADEGAEVVSIVAGVVSSEIANNEARAELISPFNCATAAVATSIAGAFQQDSSEGEEEIICHLQQATTEAADFNVIPTASLNNGVQDCYSTLHVEGETEEARVFSFSEMPEVPNNEARAQLLPQQPFPSTAPSEAEFRQDYTSEFHHVGRGHGGNNGNEEQAQVVGIEEYLHPSDIRNDVGARAELLGPDSEVVTQHSDGVGIVSASIAAGEAEIVSITEEVHPSEFCGNDAAARAELVVPDCMGTVADVIIPSEVIHHPGRQDTDITGNDAEILSITEEVHPSEFSDNDARAELVIPNHHMGTLTTVSPGDIHNTAEEGVNVLEKVDSAADEAQVMEVASELPSSANDSLRHHRATTSDADSGLCEGGEEAEIVEISENVHPSEIESVHAEAEFIGQGRCDPSSSAALPSPFAGIEDRDVRGLEKVDSAAEEAQVMEVASELPSSGDNVLTKEASLNMGAGQNNYCSGTSNEANDSLRHHRATTSDADSGLCEGGEEAEIVEISENVHPSEIESVHAEAEFIGQGRSDTSSAAALPSPCTGPEHRHVRGRSIEPQSSKAERTVVPRDFSRSPGNSRPETLADRPCCSVPCCPVSAPPLSSRSTNPFQNDPNGTNYTNPFEDDPNDTPAMSRDALLELDLAMEEEWMRAPSFGGGEPLDPPVAIPAPVVITGSDNAAFAASGQPIAAATLEPIAAAALQPVAAATLQPVAAATLEPVSSATLEHVGAASLEAVANMPLEPINVTTSEGVAHAAPVEPDTTPEGSNSYAVAHIISETQVENPQTMRESGDRSSSITDVRRDVPLPIPQPVLAGDVGGEMPIPIPQPLPAGNGNGDVSGEPPIPLPQPLSDGNDVVSSVGSCSSRGGLQRLSSGFARGMELLFGDANFPHRRSQTTFDSDSVGGCILPRTLLPSSVIYSHASSMWITTVNTNQKALESNNTIEASKSLRAFSVVDEKQARCLAQAWAPPRMIHFSDNPVCYICESKFAMFRRACHCRNCGVCVCSSCAVQWPAKMLPDTYNIKNSLFVNICKGCDWLCTNFRLALLEGNQDRAVALYSTGNVNLITPFANVKGELFYPVHCAVLGGNLGLLKWLVDEHCCPIRSVRVGAGRNRDTPGSYTQITTSKGRSLLGMALENVNIAIVRYLVVDKGVPLSLDKDVSTEKLIENFNLVLRILPGDALKEVGADTTTTDDVDSSAATAATSEVSHQQEHRDVITVHRFQTSPDEDSEDSANECIICFSNEINCVATPCGHQVCCLQCSEHISRCVVCSAECSFMRVYKP